MNRAVALLIALPLLALGSYITKRLLGSFDVVQESQAKVVKIGVVPEHGRLVGSGAIISRDGLILTCAHLFRKGGKIFVKTNSDQVYIARLVRIDAVKDLAVLKIDAPRDLPYFRLGDEPYIGQQVMAFGSPLDIQGTVTFGWVENLDGGPQRLTIQGCPINPGNSGGPLVNQRGQLIGVNVAMLTLNAFQIAQGLGLTVNMETIREFVRL